LIGRAAFNWAVMLVAMMGPMLAMPIRYIIDRSFAWRRGRGVTLFLAGYFGVWMAAGALMLAVATALPRGIATSATFVGIIVASAIAWQCSPFKQRCLNRGHSHAALAAFGRAADVDSLRVGLVHGGWCLGSCWSLMLIPYAFPAYHLTAMAVLTMWILAERLENPAPPIWRMRAPARAVRIVMVRVQMSYQSLSPINASSWKCSTQRPPVGPPERSPVG
jgi:predicted metal-binding membrane protein